MWDRNCAAEGCHRSTVVYTFPVWQRRIRHAKSYCAEHVAMFFNNYNAAPLAGPNRSSRRYDAHRFDIELVVIDEREDQPSYVFLRQEGSARRVDIGIGPWEATALRWELEGVDFPRPPTHHAMASVIQALGGELERVLIDKLSGPDTRTYEAKLHIGQAGRTVIVDVRPSDALVLAVIWDVPIYVARGVLDALETREGRRT